MLNKVYMPGFAPICMDGNDDETLRQGFLKRILKDVPQPDTNLLSEFKEFVQQTLDKYYPKNIDVMSFEEWLQSTTYNEERKNTLRDIYIRNNGEISGNASSRVDTHSKIEAYTEYKHIRLINSRTDEFKVAVGPMCKGIDKVVFSTEVDGWLWFIKNVPINERAQKIDDLVNFGMQYGAKDYTSFEASIGIELMRSCECLLYKHLYGKRADVLINAVAGVNKMKMKNGVKASVLGRRMSGEMTTSSGNGFTNMMVLRFLAHKRGGMIRGYVEGDDSIYLCTQDIPDSDFTKLGLISRGQIVDDPREASFCGNIFSDSHEIIKDPIRSISKFAWTSSFINAGPKIMDELLRAKCLSIKYETPQCPILSALATYGLNVTRGVQPRFVNDGYHQCPPDEFELPEFNPQFSTRLLYEKLYGITIKEQLEVESAILKGELHRVQDYVVPPGHIQHYHDNYIEKG